MTDRYKRYVAAKLQKSGFSELKSIPNTEYITAKARNGAKVLVQCLYSEFTVDTYDIESAAEAKTIYECAAVMVVTNSHFTAEAEALAAQKRIMLKGGISLPQESLTDRTSSQQLTVTPQSAVTDTTKQKQYKHRKRLKGSFARFARQLLALVFVMAVLCVIASMCSRAERANPTLEEPTAPKDRITIYSDLDTSEYYPIHKDVLYEYGAYFVDDRIITVVEVADVSDTEISADVDEDYHYDLVFEFSSKNVLEGVEDGDTLTIMGLVDQTSFLGTVQVKNCFIVGLGEITSDLITNKNIQRAEGYERVKAKEQEAELAEQKRKDEFIASCETVVYNDVARNPDQFQDKHVKISGKVIQVSEVSLIAQTSVTLRVDCDGDIWYVTYTRSNDESRILEDDLITCYGTCQGVETYTSILGSQITIPSLKMYYYE